LMAGGFENDALELGGVLLVIHAENSCHTNFQDCCSGAELGTGTNEYRITVMR
jgi:hypothetical protein